MTLSRVWLCFVIRCGVVVRAIVSMFAASGQYHLFNSSSDRYYTPPMRQSHPVTEDHVSARADIDLRPTLDLVELINDEDSSVPGAVRAAAGSIAAAIDGIVGRLELGGRLVYVGAGSSGRLALVDALECGPTFGVPAGAGARARRGRRDRARGRAGGGRGRRGGRSPGRRRGGVNGRDAVVLLSASGGTPYVAGAARAARDAGALTIAVVCVEASPLGRTADHEIAVVVGPEVISGSTRMKAGTAQKLVLNTISTVAMVRLGKTYGNLMVDVVASNAKLRKRARRAVAIATGAADDEVDAALEAGGGDVKVAIVSLLSGVDAEEARLRLEASAGVVRRALERDGAR